MALEKCPHMIARCPHFQRSCRDPESKYCHHIIHARAAMITALSAINKFDIEGLPEEMRESMEETRAFLRNEAFLRGQK